MGMLISLISSISESTRFYVRQALQIVGHRLNFGYNRVCLEGKSRCNAFFNEQYVFSVDFKAVIDYILSESSQKEENRSRLNNLVEFLSDDDVRYDREDDVARHDRKFAFIANQPTPIFVDEDLDAIMETTYSNLDETAGARGNTREIQTVTYTITLRSKVKSCIEITEWIAKCTQNYKDKRESVLKKTRHIVKYNGPSGDSGPALSWDSSALVNNTGFDCIFFKNKDKLVDIIRRFLKEEEFYKAIGKPYQLGILLSGPPGTGKTSIIRALSYELKRNVKDINFSKILTNKEFQNVFRCSVYNGIDIKPESSIIIGEDIDCNNTEALWKRELINEEACGKKNGKGKRQDKSSRLTKLKDIVLKQSDESQVDDGNDLGEEIGASGYRNESGSSLSPSASIVSSKDSDEEEMTIVGLLSEHIEYDKKCTAKTQRNQNRESDALDLSTVLNELDGIKSSCGRIMILTTNHPEKLDDALLRPGRIDHHIRLGNWSIDEIYDCCKFWYMMYDKHVGQKEGGNGDGTDSTERRFKFEDRFLFEERFDVKWGLAKDALLTKEISPCVVQNILQKHGGAVEDAIDELASQ